MHGIIVQLPPDSSEPIDPSVCTNAVAPEKDVDGWVIEKHKHCLQYTHTFG